MSSKCPCCNGTGYVDTLAADLADAFGLKTGFMAHEAVRALRLDYSARKLGKRLSRMCDKPQPGGYVVENISLEHNSAIWWVRGV